jgi:endonuclease/exonuclease/phosphatase family metal-dependent hydrolase
MRIATFNVENLFSRPVALNFDNWDDGKPILAEYGAFNTITSKPVYSADDKAELLRIMNRWGMTTAHANTKYFLLRDIRGDLATYAGGQAKAIRANGRADWLGWLDLKRETVNAAAIHNTARVITEVDPDVLLIVEVESRSTLERFYRQAVWPLLKAQGSAPHSIFMLVDGNDVRGIDIGLISRYPLVGMRSNVDRLSPKGTPVFGRDCVEFYVDVGRRSFVAVLGNHLASKASDRTGARRRLQSAEIAKIVADVRKRTPWIVVAGDLNDHPGGGSLDELTQHPELTDAMALPLYQGRPGTYKTASAANKLDYLLLSKSLQSKVRAVDVNRRGYFSTLWEPFEDIKQAQADKRGLLQASDHHCLWADIAV